MPDSSARIKNLLEQIEQKYPLARLADSRRKWEDLWDLKKEFRMPPVVLHRGRMSDGSRHPAHHDSDSRAATLIQKLEDIVAMADIEDDYIPVITLDTGAYILAEAFGGERVYTGGMYIIHPFLETEEDVELLAPFDPDADHHYMNMVFDTLRFFSEATEGRIQINIHTPQGPLETLGCMWESTGFYMALIDNPELVLGALHKITEGYIYYIKRQKDLIGKDRVQFNYAMSYCHRPAGTGIGVGEDVIATIGPDLFELTLPIYERIAEQFGPILLHSCGNPRQQLPTVMETAAIQGFHFSQLNAGDFMPGVTRPMVMHSRNDWESFEQLEEYAGVARQFGHRIAYQFQSLADWMCVGTDKSSYDPIRQNEMFLKVKEILNHE